MPVHDLDYWGLATSGPRFYAYCIRRGCGVCGPLRRDRALAVADSEAHALCCSAGRAS